MTYIGKFKYPVKSSNPCNDNFAPGRLSVDLNAVRKKSLAENYHLIATHNILNRSTVIHALARRRVSKLWCPERFFGASYMAPTVRSRKHGIEVPSRFLTSNSRRSSTDLCSNQKASVNNSSSNSPIADAKGKTTNSKPSKGKEVGNILSIGIGFLKGKKSSSSVALPLGLGLSEDVHQLRLLLNGLMQWRLCNSRAEAVQRNAIRKAKMDIWQAWNGLIKLRQSVLHKKLQFQKEKLEMKLNYILCSHRKALEIWGSMERQHLSSISITKDCLHCVVCRMPLVNGAKVEAQSTSNALKHASDMATSISLMLTTFSPMLVETLRVVSELATVVTQEKLLLEECLDLSRNIATLEMQERSLKSAIMQLSLVHQQQQQSMCS